MPQNMTQSSPEPPESRPQFLRAAPPAGGPGAPASTDPGDFERALHLAVPAAPSALAPARDSTRTFLRGFDVPEPSVFDIVLSLEEACKNAIRFSGSQRDIDVTVAVTSREVRLVIRDHGVGFKPPEVDISRTPDLSDQQGRGLFLIHCLMDDVRIACDDGAIVTARKAVTH
jgi:serine/threonine-protein kinase RsbW